MLLVCGMYACLVIRVTVEAACICHACFDGPLMSLMVLEFLWCTCLTAVPTRGRYVYPSMRCGACLLTRLTCLRCACLRRYQPAFPLRCLLGVPACSAYLQCMLTVVPAYGGTCLRCIFLSCTCFERPACCTVSAVPICSVC